MRRVFAIVLVVVALAALLAILMGARSAGGSISAAEYNPSQTAGPAQDTVYGGGRYGGGGSCSDGPVPFCPPNSREFSVDAHASPSDAGAYGALLYGVPETGATIVRGQVTCLAVAGNQAVVGGVTASGGPFMIYFQDLGPAGSITRDRVSPVLLLEPANVPARFPRECSPLGNNAFGVGYFELSAGDVVVRDE